MFDLPEAIQLLIWSYIDIKENYNNVVKQLDKYNGYKTSYNIVVNRINRFPTYIKSINDSHHFEALCIISANLILTDPFSVRCEYYKKAFIIAIKVTVAYTI